MRRIAWISAAILMVLRRWNAEKAALAAAQRSVPSSVAATSDELARLDAAVRGDDRP